MGNDVGDMDRDGLSEVVLTGGVVDDIGLANLFFGASIPGSGTVGVADADFRFKGEASRRTAPLWGAVAGGKDVNGDGIEDILMSDDGFSDNGIDYPTGRAYLIHGW